MCETCDDAGRIKGRVEHTRYVSQARRYSAATNGYEMQAWSEGDIPCPTCQKGLYGKITKVSVWRKLPR